jgi:hypothetical protein
MGRLLPDNDPATIGWKAPEAVVGTIELENAGSP